MLNKNILGTKPRARRKELMDNLDQYFSNPIIHREIHGDKVYVSLYLKRICPWLQQRWYWAE